MVLLSCTISTQCKKKMVWRHVRPYINKTGPSNFTHKKRRVQSINLLMRLVTSINKTSLVPSINPLIRLRFHSFTQWWDWFHPLTHNNKTGSIHKQDIISVAILNLFFPKKIRYPLIPKYINIIGLSILSLFFNNYYILSYC